tara:strand:+ start:361 stop:570 length:210 start_codon:yes stop_codon:yes gene_type:complete
MYIAKIAYTKTFLQIEKPNQDGMQDNNLFYKKKAARERSKTCGFQPRCNHTPLSKEKWRENLKGLCYSL